MPDPKILVCNVGSSTFKVSYHDGAPGKKLSADTIEGDLGHFTDSLEKLLPELATVQTVLHRIVHAGAVTEGAFELDAACRQNIQHWSQLAPLHNSRALKIVELLDKRLPAAKQYAIFDSGLYSNLPDVARHYAIPDSLDPQWPIQRYGFHGLAHRSQWRDLQEQLDFNRAITLQLGSGCSASAWLGDQVIDTSMGFTPLDGLMMARRSGAIDPGILLHLLTSGAMSPAELESLLNQESGLAGITRSSGDLREILAMDSPEGKLAVALFCNQIKKQIGAYYFALGRL